MFVRMISSESQNILLPDLVWWCTIMSQSVMWIFFFVCLLLSSRSRSQWDSYKGLTFFYYIFLTADSFATKRNLLCHKPECLLQKRKEKISMCKVKVTVNIQNVSECLSGWYLLNRRTFCYQTWCGDAASWARVSCGEKLFAFFKVKATVKLLW